MKKKLYLFFKCIIIAIVSFIVFYSLLLVVNEILIYILVPPGDQGWKFNLVKYIDLFSPLISFFLAVNTIWLDEYGRQKIWCALILLFIFVIPFYFDFILRLAEINHN